MAMEKVTDLSERPREAIPTPIRKPPVAVGDVVQIVDVMSAFYGCCGVVDLIEGGKIGFVVPRPGELPVVGWADRTRVARIGLPARELRNGAFHRVPRLASL